MTIEFGFVQAASNTSTGNQTFTDSNMTVSPKVAILMATNGLTAGSAVVQHNMAFGVCTSTDQWAVSMNDESIEVTSDPTSSIANDVCLQKYLPGSTSQMELDAAWVSFGTGAVTINHQTAPPSAWLITVILIGGTSFNVDVGTITPNSSVSGTASISSLAFGPEGGIFLSATANVNNTGADANGGLSIGVMSYLASTIVQRCFRIESDPGVGTSSLAARIHSDRVSMDINDTSGAMVDSVEVTGVDASSVTLTTRDGGSPTDIGYCVFDTNGNEFVYVGDFDSPNSTGNDSLSGFGITPRMALTVSTLTSAFNTSYADSNAGAYCIGVAVEDEALTLKTGAIRAASEDAAGTMNTESATEDSYNIRVTDDTGGANLLADTTSFDAGGMTQNWTTHTASGARKGFVLALGGAGGGVAKKASHIYRMQRGNN